MECEPAMDFVVLHLRVVKKDKTNNNISKAFFFVLMKI